MSMKSLLHTVSTLLFHPGLGGGSNLGLEKGSQILKWIGDVADEAGPQLAELEKDVKAIFRNNGSPPRGLWEEMVEKYTQVEEVVDDVKEVVKTVKKPRGKAATADKPTEPTKDDPPKDTSKDAPKLDPQP